jgi:hypothetical protein
MFNPELLIALSESINKDKEHKQFEQNMRDKELNESSKEFLDLLYPEHEDKNYE